MDKLEEIKSTFVKFLGYNVRNIDFKINEQFINSGEQQGQIEVTFNFSVGFQVDVEHQRVVVLLEAVVFDDPVVHNYPFSITVAITGTFEAVNLEPEEKLVEIGETVGMATLFPFLRSIISNVCVQANMPPVILPLVNVSNLLHQEKEKANSKGQI